MRIPLTLVAACLVASSATAHAQNTGDTPPKAQRIRSVERGAFAEANFGAAFIVNSVQDRDYPVGVLVGLFFGYDLTPWMSLMLGAETIAASGTDTETAQGSDLLFVNPMLQLQIALVTTERDFLWGRVGGGVTFAFPFELSGRDTGGIGGAFSATIGYEHFTRLRHFSIGARVGLSGMTTPDLAFAVTVMPTLKYTF